MQILMPLILLFCIVGTFAINNSLFEVGVVLGGMLEENFITSMIKSDGNLGAFFSRPIALGLAVVTMFVWFMPAVMKLFRARRPVPV